MSWKIDRRRLLTGAGCVFALPLLESFFDKTARASGTSDPRRFVSLYMPQGTYNRKGDAVWYPATGPLTTGLPDVLSPFASHTSDFSVLKHLGCRALNGNGGHGSALVTWLTQTAPMNPGASGPPFDGTVTSFDQLAADALKKPHLVMSCGLRWGGGVDNFPNWSEAGTYVTFKNGQGVAPHTNPVELYKNVFSQLVSGSGPAAPVPAAARNRSILDNATADIKDLQNKLGKNDRMKLDDHFTSLRNLEQRLSAVAVGGGCSGGPPDSTLDTSDINGTGDGTSYTKRVQAFMDMIVLAFKCDLVRTVSFMYDGEVGDRQRLLDCPASLIYNNADITAGMHVGVSHYFGPSGGGRDRTISRDRYYLYFFFYLLDALKQALDPSGSPMLDNTAVFAGYGVLDGNHDPANSEGTPLVLGGGRNVLHPGNAFELGGKDMTDLFFTFSQFLNLGWNDFRGSSTTLSV